MSEKKVIEEKSNIPVRITGDFISPINMPDAKRLIGEPNEISGILKSSSKSACDYYEKIFSLIQANPSNDMVVDALSSIYYFSDFGSGNRNDIANTKIGYKEFNKLISSDDLDHCCPKQFKN